MSEKEIYEKAVLNYGVDVQLNLVCEECAELIVAINKWNRGKVQYNKVIEECIDVLIMINQLKHIFPYPIEWDRMKRMKLERLKGKLFTDVEDRGKM